MVIKLSSLYVFSCMKLALVHDMAECIVGDITPYCGVSKDEKHAKERVSVWALIKLLTTRGHLKTAH